MIVIPLEDMRFACQQSGNCCCDPNILVTLTYNDLSRLFRLYEKDFQQIFRRISFYRLEEGKITSNLLKKVVLHPIHTSDGQLIPALKKHKGGVCSFYYKPNCSIHASRPLACRNYPLAFDKKKDQVYCIWAKNAKTTCAGIGIGQPLPLNQLETQASQFLEEVEKHNQVVEELNTEAAQGKPLSAREALWVLIAFGEKENSN